MNRGEISFIDPNRLGVQYTIDLLRSSSSQGFLYSMSPRGLMGSFDHRAMFVQNEHLVVALVQDVQ